MEERVRFRDVKVYDTVASLEELQGQSSGTLHLPTRLWWSSPRQSFDLGDRELRRVAYSAVIANGLSGDLKHYLNKELLVEEWPHLRLDQRVVQLWTKKHPELASLRMWRTWA